MVFTKLSKFNKFAAKSSISKIAVFTCFFLAACGDNKSDLSYYLATQGVKGPGIPDKKEVPKAYKKRLAEKRLRNDLAETIGVKIPDLDEQLSQAPAKFENGDFYKFDNPDITWTVRDANDYQIIWADNSGGQQVSYPNPILPALEWSSVRRGNGTRKISDIDGDIFPLDVGNVMTFRSQVEASGGQNGQNISWEFDWRCEVVDHIANYPTLVGSYHVYNVLCGRDGRNEISFYYAPRIGFYVRMEIFDEAGKPPTVRNLQEYRNKWLANEEQQYYDLLTKRQRAEALLYQDDKNNLDKPIKGKEGDPLPPAFIFSNAQSFNSLNNNLNTQHSGLGIDNVTNNGQIDQNANIGIEQELSQLLEKNGNFENDNILQPYQPNLDLNNNSQQDNSNVAIAPQYQQQLYQNIKRLDNTLPSNNATLQNTGYGQPAKDFIAEKTSQQLSKYQLHLASYRDADLAREGWFEYVNKLRGLVSDLQPVISKVNLGNRGVYYRLMGQGLRDRTQAIQRCSLIEGETGYCKIFTQ